MQNVKPIPQKMIDEAMQKIIDYYTTYSASHQIDEGFLLFQGVCKESEVKRLIKILCVKCFITYNRDSPREPFIIRLTPLGEQYLEMRRDERSKERKQSVRYWITTSIAVAALVKAFLPEISAGLALLLNILKQQQIATSGSQDVCAQIALTLLLFSTPA